METSVVGEHGLLELHVTVLSLPVDDADTAVHDLAGRGVSFERSEGFGQDERGVAHGEPRIGWSEDPARYVLSVLQA